MSALPPKADIFVSCRKSPLMTHNGHSVELVAYRFGYETGRPPPPLKGVDWYGGHDPAATPVISSRASCLF